LPSESDFQITHHYLAREEGIAEEKIFFLSPMVFCKNAYVFGITVGWISDA